jgi:hypothetical protein
MRRTLRDLADARKELFEIQQEFGCLQRRIDAAVAECRGRRIPSRSQAALGGVLSEQPELALNILSPVSKRHSR